MAAAILLFSGVYSCIEPDDEPVNGSKEEQVNDPDEEQVNDPNEEPNGNDIGTGMSLLDDADDPTGVLLDVKLTSAQWTKLTGSNTFYAELRTLSDSIYTRFEDNFDFIFFVLNTAKDDAIINALGFYGVNMNVSNAVTGLGLSTFKDPRWGSADKLKSVMFFPFADAIKNGPTLHELCHNWGANIVPTWDAEGKSYSSHWGISNAGGQLGGFKYVRNVSGNLYQASFRSDETNADGSFKYGGFGENANGGNGLPYSDIELYIMGMKSAQDLRDGSFRLDIYSGNSCNRDGDPSFWEGYFTSTTVTSYTIDKLIELKGARVPDASTSQKNFRILTVSLTPPSGTNYHSDIIAAMNWLSGETPAIAGIYNFSQATGGIGSLTVDRIKNSLKQ
ncbi:hypothetical protein AGMMS49982_09470 [Bacteroidia bacterium]|nr:hypothetical protein AGMMS49982_09470 [Bacteroidia bacterium]